MAGRLVAATQALWARVAPKMLPTPAKFHYLFNMRDISKARTFFGTCPSPGITEVYAALQYHSSTF